MERREGCLGRHLSRRWHPKKPYIWRNLWCATITSRNLLKSPPFVDETDNPQNFCINYNTLWMRACVIMRHVLLMHGACPPLGLTIIYLQRTALPPNASFDIICAPVSSSDKPFSGDWLWYILKYFCAHLYLLDSRYSSGYDNLKQKLRNIR